MQCVQYITWSMILLLEFSSQNLNYRFRLFFCEKSSRLPLVVSYEEYRQLPNEYRQTYNNGERPQNSKYGTRGFEHSWNSTDSSCLSKFSNFLFD